MVLCVPTLEVLEDGNVGLHPITSAAFLLIPFRSQSNLHCLLKDANSPSPVLNAVYGIDWAQQMAGLSKISNHPLVSLMVSASQRILGRPKVKKDPVTPEMLKALAQSRTTDKSPSLSDLRSVALFRFSELCHIKACDVKFFPSYVSIFLESSKTVTGRGSLSHEVRSMDACWLHLLLLQGQGCQ